MSWNGLDKRKFPRANYPCLIVIRHNQGGPEAMLTHTENLGIGGVCVILKKSIKLFTSVEVELDLLDTETHIKCNGRVVWAVQRRNPQEKKTTFYDTGIEFTGINTKDQKRVDEIVQRLIKMGLETPYTDKP